MATLRECWSGHHNADIILRDTWPDTDLILVTNCRAIHGLDKLTPSTSNNDDSYLHFNLIPCTYLAYC